MKQLILCTVIILGSFAANAQTNGDEILGRWKNDQKTSVIEFQKSGDKYVAKLVWMSEPTDAKGDLKQDRNNPDRSKRDRALLGIIIINGLHFDGTQWVGGEVYAPGRGSYAQCSIRIVNGELNLMVSKGLFSVTKVWSKVS